LAPVISASLPTEREVIGLICRTVAEVERARVEFFASLPTEREFIDLICRTVAEVERGRLEWLASFVARGTVPE
jgi:hypothetical protein